MSNREILALNWEDIHRIFDNYFQFWITKKYSSADEIVSFSDNELFAFDAAANTLYLSGIHTEASSIMVAFYDKVGKMAMAKTYTADVAAAGVAVTDEALEFSQYTRTVPTYL